jgi:hypothetical protein
MSDDARYPVADVRRYFADHGYDGPLLIVDDSGDEAIFLVEQGSTVVNDADLAITLGSLLHRKVWIVEATPIWRRQARSFA